MLKIGLSVVGGFLTRFLGGFDMIIITLIIFVAMDYLTGVMKAIDNKELSSEIGFKGIFKKVLIFFMVGIATQLDIILPTDIGIRYIVIIFYIINEGLSIIENASLLGLKIPQKIKDTLSILKNNQKQ